MSTLMEIKKAAEALPPEQKQELLLFLASQMRASGDALPGPRQYTPQRVRGWLAEDESDMRRFREGA